METALETVVRLLDELGCKYELHRFGDAEYGWLGEGELSLAVINPNPDRNMDIDFQDEISLFFAEWHDHFPLDETKDLCTVITGIVRNEICSSAHFHGNEQWGGSGLSCRDKARLSDYFQYMTQLMKKLPNTPKHGLILMKPTRCGLNSGIRNSIKRSFSRKNHNGRSL